MKICPRCSCLHSDRAIKCRACDLSFTEVQPAKQLHFHFLFSPLGLSILWLVIIAAFTSYGFFGPGFEVQNNGSQFYWDIALEPALGYGALGFCSATSFVVGLAVIKGVRSRSLARWKGVLILFGSMVVSVIVPPTFMTLSGLFQGETGMWIFVESYFASITAVSLFIVLVVTALCMRRR